jgi:hypothetical protein
MIKKKTLPVPQSIGIIFIRWNLYNRVAVAVAYFELEEMVHMTISKSKIRKLCSNFLDKNVSYDFALSYPNAMKKQKTNVEFWNKQWSVQNGLIEIQKPSYVGIRLNKSEFNKFAKLYIK